jgi:hypothetical protein
MPPVKEIVKRSVKPNVFQRRFALIRKPPFSSSLAVEDHPIGRQKRCARRA